MWVMLAIAGGSSVRRLVSHTLRDGGTLHRRAPHDAYDVARRAGVSVGTVPRYLTGNGYLGDSAADSVTLRP